jgi:peptidylprolyl isomerase
MHLKFFFVLSSVFILMGCPRPLSSASAATQKSDAPKGKQVQAQNANTRTPPPPPAPLPAPKDLLTPPSDAVVAASGLKSRVLEAGKGTKKPGKEDVVQVNYTGWDKTGKMFDSSVVRGTPATFPLNRVIPGWTEGVALMVEGEKRRLWIPAAMAYGEKPQRPGAPSGDLVFDVELLKIMDPPKEVKTPADVAAAPADAKATASGLKYKSLSPGNGKDKPTAANVVEVHYSGWTTDGKMFDSSVKRGVPTTFPLNRVIPGWTEGLQLMSVGESMRFWIPGPLAYGDKPQRPGAPAGTLVFDVELLKIVQ